MRTDPVITLNLIGWIVLIISIIIYYFSTKKPKCDHEFYQDTQITVLKYHKCGCKGRFMGYKNLYPSNLSEDKTFLKFNYKDK